MTALSDGLFAIALTLLVLDLKPQEASGAGLTYPELVQLWPRLFAFFLTFMVGGSYWIAHHIDLETIDSVDRTCLWLNLTFLLSVSLLPFTTALIGEKTNASTWTLYAINMISIGLTLAAVWGYAGSTRQREPAPPSAEQLNQTVRHLVVPAVFALSIPIGFASPSLAPYTALLVPVVNSVYTRLTGRSEPARQPLSARARVWLIVGFAPVGAFVAWSIWLGVTGQLP